MSRITKDKKNKKEEKLRLLLKLISHATLGWRLMMCQWPSSANVVA